MQEANRESAARSRDKRLKLIADLEVEVQALKKQHTEFKVRSRHRRHRPPRAMARPPRPPLFRVW